jgi:hypothetical protein
LIAGDTTVAPTGSLSVDLSFHSGGKLGALLNGTTAGTGYDQVTVNTGTVTIIGAALNLSVGSGFTPSVGASFDILVNNTGAPVSGVFAGLPEGATLFGGSQLFQITYKGGGSGHDIVLTKVALPAIAVTSVTVNANTFPILTATESSTTVTITTNGPHGFILGESVAIQGVSVPGYNGVQIITGITDASHFTYTAASGLANATLGTASEAQANTASISTATSSGTTAAITTAAAHNFTVGQIVTVAGVSVTGYNGSFAIASIPDSTHFTYTTSGSNLANGTGGTGTLNSPLAGAQRSMVDSLVYTFNHAVTLGAGAFTLSVHGAVAISTATSSGTTATITTATANTFAAGQQVVIAGVSVAGYNGTFIIVTAPTNTQFTYTTVGSNLANGSGGSASPNGGTVPTVSYSSPDGGVTWVVSFSGSGVTGNSIADGVYDVTLIASAVTDAGGQALAANRADTFWRLYGDFTGAKTVNNADRLKFNLAFGTSAGAANFLAALDANDDGTINNLDRLKFNPNFGKTLSGFTATI